MGTITTNRIKKESLFANNKYNIWENLFKRGYKMIYINSKKNMNTF